MTNDSNLKQNFYWGVELKAQQIQSRQNKLIQQKNFYYLLLTLGGVGLTNFFLYILIHPFSLFTLSFLSNKSILLFVFYLSLIPDLFLIRSYAEKDMSQNKIKRLVLDNQQCHSNIEISPAFADDFWTILTQAWQRKQMIRPTQPLTLLEFFWEYVASPYFADLSQRLNIEQNALKASLQKQIVSANHTVSEQQPTSSLEPILVQTLQDAFISAYQQNLAEVDLITISEFLYQNSNLLQEIFFAFEADQDEVLGCFRWQKINRLLNEQMSNYQRLARFKVTGDMNASYTAVATPTLNEFARDLTVLAKKQELALCIGRDDELTQILQAFKGGQNGLVLVGPHQVGKKTIIDGLAQLMVTEKVPLQLHDKRLVALEMSKIFGDVDPQESQKRFFHILEEVKRAGNIVLLIDNINTILHKDANIGQTDQLGYDFVKIITEAIINKQIFFITTCDDAIYTRYLEKLSLGQNLLKIVIEEPDVDKTIMILQTKTMNLEKKYHLTFSYDGLQTASEASKKYLLSKNLPQKAIEVIELAAALAQDRCKKNNLSTCVCGTDDALAVISQLTKIPLQKVTASESETLINLEQELHRYVIGQNEAVDAVANALRRARTNLKNDNKPLASFLFLGPTGVGKTELSKTVARTYFGDETAMIRLDMSEYQLASDVIKMIGDPHSAVGYLTEAVYKKPYTLILFDEIEKAHPDILNLFLQLLDDGRLTDGRGQTVNFAHTIVIATSNAGANYIHQAVGRGESNEQIKHKLLNELLFEHFKPEFINRFDDVIVFRSLQLPEIAQIVKLALQDIAHNLHQKGIFLEVGPIAINKLAQDSYDPQYGARPLKRFLKDKIENQIALLLLENKLKRRDKIIIADDLSLQIVSANAL